MEELGTNHYLKSSVYMEKRAREDENENENERAQWRWRKEKRARDATSHLLYSMPSTSKDSYSR
jgi:hypothetical protein